MKITLHAQLHPWEEDIFVVVVLGVLQVWVFVLGFLSLIFGLE